MNDAVLNPNREHEMTNLSSTDFETSTEHTLSGEPETVHVFISSLDFAGSYNIPPTSGGVMIYMDKDRNYIIEPLKFGMLPAYAKPQDPLAVKRASLVGPAYSREVQLQQAKYFNCRKETICRPQTIWATPRKSHRCVVPIQGYFEWHRTDKTPYYVFLKDSPLIFLAGLYSHNHNYNDTDLVPKDREYFSSFSIATGPGGGVGSNDLAWLHSRKPIMLKPNTKEWFEWLEPNDIWDPSLLDTALNTDTNPAYDGITSYVVSKAVGNPNIKGPEIIKEEKVKQKTIGLFFLPRKQKTDAEEVKTPTKEMKDPKEVKSESENTEDAGHLNENSKRTAESPIFSAKRVQLLFQGSETMLRRDDSDSDS